MPIAICHLFFQLWMKTWSSHIAGFILEQVIIILAGFYVNHEKNCEVVWEFHSTLAGAKNNGGGGMKILFVFDCDTDISRYYVNQFMNCYSINTMTVSPTKVEVASFWMICLVSHFEFLVPHSGIPPILLPLLRKMKL